MPLIEILMGILPNVELDDGHLGLLHRFLPFQQTRKSVFFQLCGESQWCRTVRFTIMCDQLSSKNAALFQQYQSGALHVLSLHDADFQLTANRKGNVGERWMVLGWLSKMDS